MIFSDFQKALSQLSDSRFLGVFLRAIGLTILLLGVVGYGALWLLPDSVSLPWIGEIGWLSTMLSGFALFAILGMSFFLMIPVATLFIGFFLERIVDAVEDKFYPAAGDVTPLEISDLAFDALKFTGLVIVANLFALIIYLLSTVLAPFIFWIVNGVLISREYFTLVAMRRLGRKGAAELRRKHRLQIWGAGILMAIPLTIPLINLLVPVLGVATFTHLFHRLWRG